MMTHQRKMNNKKKRWHHKKRGHNLNSTKPSVTTHQGVRNTKQQVKGQQKPKLAKHVRKQASQKPTKNDWFRDGLSNSELSARNWISFHESGHRWNILSYGGRCIGYFQLDPSYLGRKNGHINLNHQHQVKVADAYVHSRYGSWQNAKRFWQAHHWY